MRGTHRAITGRPATDLEPSALTARVELLSGEHGGIRSARVVRRPVRELEGPREAEHTKAVGVDSPERSRFPRRCDRRDGDRVDATRDADARTGFTTARPDTRRRVAEARATTGATAAAETVRAAMITGFVCDQRWLAGSHPGCFWFIAGIWTAIECCVRIGPTVAGYLLPNVRRVSLEKNTKKRAPIISFISSRFTLAL